MESRAGRVAAVLTPGWLGHSVSGRELGGDKSLFRTCYSRGGGRCHLVLAKTQRQAEWEREGDGCALMGASGPGRLETSSVKAAVVWLAKVPLWLSLVGPKLEGGWGQKRGKL